MPTPKSKSKPSSRNAKVPAPQQPQKQSAAPGPGVVGGYSYPGGFPYDSVKEVVRIIRQGQLQEQKAAFGKHVWVMQGYAQSVLLGDPDNQSRPGHDGGQRLQDQVVVDILDSLLRQQQDGPAPQALGSATVQLSAGSALAALLKWSVTKLLELAEQELTAAIL